jgi:hypothetical protein
LYNVFVLLRAVNQSAEQGTRLLLIFETTQLSRSADHAVALLLTRMRLFGIDMRSQCGK